MKIDFRALNARKLETDSELKLIEHQKHICDINKNEQNTLGFNLISYERALWTKAVQCETIKIGI